MVFVDTSFLIALLNERDDHHRDAVTLNASLACTGRLLTTNHIVAEAWTRTTSAYSVQHVSAVEEDRAADWLLRHDEREYSVVDATSFETMRSLGIREALSFDSDFEAAGFVTLRA